jgi:hypothetical protein
MKRAYLVADCFVNLFYMEKVCEVSMTDPQIPSRGTYPQITFLDVIFLECRTLMKVPSVL